VREAENLTTFMCQMSLKSGSLNLEPSGPHRACYGTALPFLLASGLTSLVFVCLQFVKFGQSGLAWNGFIDFVLIY